MIERWQDRIVHTTMGILDLTNPVTAVGYSLEGVGTGGIFNPVVPRAMKLVGYAVSTITLGDTTPGNWTARFRVNESGSDTATFSVNVTTTLTKQSGQWSTTPILQAGDSFNVLINGPSKNAIGSYLTLEWEII